MSPDAFKDYVRSEAKAIGFDVVGFAPAQLDGQAGEHLRDFLARDHHGEMEWMADRVEHRSSPHHLWEEVRSVIVLGMNYGPDRNPMERLSERGLGNISVYAENRDYHEIVKGKLKMLAQKLLAQAGEGAVKVFVDTAPVMEKPLAAQSAIGWQGKHTCLVSREFGSWLFLGEIFTTLELEPDEAEDDHCGRCSRCLDICPTQAFTAARELDARRCISYLTIEHPGHIAREFRQPMGNRIYGCDDCLAVCPWNKFAQVAQESRFHPREALEAPLLSDLLALDDVAFRVLFSRSAAKRIGRDRFVRNVLIAAGNSGDSALIPKVEALLDDPSPLVRAMAVWALAQLLDSPRFEKLRDHCLPIERDVAVCEEWRSGQS